MQDIHGCEIDPVWVAEFRGFFCADGYLGIVRDGKSRKGNQIYTARVNISLRLDDLPILEEIQKRLGGCICFAGARTKQKGDGSKVLVSNPTATWRVSGIKNITRVCDLLEGGIIPFRKKDQVTNIRSFLCLKAPKGPTSESKWAAWNDQRIVHWKLNQQQHAFQD